MPEDMSSPIDNSQYNPMTAGLHPTTTALELSSTDILNDFIHSLRGEEKDPITNKFVKTGNPMMNDKGISAIKTILLAATSRDKILADLTEDDINNLAKDGILSFIVLLSQKWEEWEIDKTSLDKIRWLIEYTYFSSMTRAKDANTLKQIAQMTESRDINAPMKQSTSEGDSLWKKLSPFG